MSFISSFVTLLEDKFADAYIPEKNISVDEGLVKFNGSLSFKKRNAYCLLAFEGVVWAEGSSRYWVKKPYFLEKNKNREV